MRSLDFTVDFFEGLMAARRKGPYWTTFERLLARLKGRRLRAPFAGALALNAHGVVRTTQDIDLVVHPEDKERALRLLTPVFPLREDLDTLVVLVDGRTDIEIDLLVAYDEISLEACTRPVVAPVAGHRVKVVPIDSLAAMKVMAAVDNPAAELKQGSDVELLIRTGRLDVNAIARRLHDALGPEYARYFLERARTVREHPCLQVPPKRR